MADDVDPISRSGDDEDHPSSTIAAEAAAADDKADAADRAADARDVRADTREGRERTREEHRGGLDPANERARRAAGADRTASTVDRGNSAGDRIRDRADRDEADETHRFFTIDPGTGVPMRDSGMEALRRLYERTDGCLVVAFVDVLASKEAGQHGRVTDETLRTVASALVSSVRRDDVVMRFGGTVFLVGAQQLSLLEIGVSFAAVAATLSEHGDATLAFGLADPNRGELLTNVIERADAALYASRRRLRSV